MAELPFDADYKFMATFHNMTDEQGQPVVRAFVKGAQDVLIGQQQFLWIRAAKSCPSPMRTANWRSMK